MTLNEARNECRRYLNYLAVQEEKAIALQRLASDRRNGRCDAKEGERRMRDIQGANPTVYDSTNLAEAVKVMLRHTEPQIRASATPPQETDRREG